MSRKREREVGRRGSHARARTFATPPNPLPGLTASQLWGMGSWREVGVGGERLGSQVTRFCANRQPQKNFNVQPKVKVSRSD